MRLEPSISYYSHENRSFTEAQLGIFGLIYDYPKLDIGSTFIYQKLDLVPNSSFERITLLFDKRVWRFNGHLGFGLNRFGENSNNTFGITVGMDKEVKLSRYRFLVVDTNLTWWNKNFQFDTTLGYRFFGRFELELGHRYFNGAHLVLINLGCSIRFWQKVDNSYKSYDQ